MVPTGTPWYGMPCAAPGGQCGEQAAVIWAASVPMWRRTSSKYTASCRRDLQRLVEPLAEAQVAHAATLVAAGPELGRAMEDAAAVIAHSPAGGAAEVEGEDGWDDRARRVATGAGRAAATIMMVSLR